MQFKNESIGEQNCIEIWGAKQTYDERIAKIIRFIDLDSRYYYDSTCTITISILVKTTSRAIILKQKGAGLMEKYSIATNSGQCMWSGYINR